MCGGGGGLRMEHQDLWRRPLLRIVPPTRRRVAGADGEVRHPWPHGWRVGDGIGSCSRASPLALGANLEIVVPSIVRRPAPLTRHVDDLQLAESGGWLGIMGLGALDQGNPLDKCGGHDVGNAPEVVLIGGTETLRLSSISMSR